MQEENNIVPFEKEVDKAIATFQKSCPQDIKVSISDRKFSVPGL
jgi:multidrug efflux pump subunit AcrB